MSWYKIDQRKNNFAGRYIHHAELDKIISQAVKAENEACALECEQFVKTFRGTTSMILIIKIARAIRARGKG